MKKLLILSLSLLSGWCGAEATFSQPYYKSQVKTIASDEFEGRAPMSEGEEKTIQYLVQELKALGVDPGYKGGFVQTLPMAGIAAYQDMQLKLGDMVLKPGQDFVSRTQKWTTSTELKDSEVLFVGYGIDAPEYGWNDYEGVDVKGKTLLMLVNDPGYATQDPKVFRGNAMTYYGRWTYKYEEAIRRGAAGVFIIHETGAAGYPWSVVESGATGTKFALVDNTGNADELEAMAWIQTEATRALFKSLDLDYDKIKAAAAKPGFKAMDLGIKANLKTRYFRQMGESRNVVGLIPGSSKADEYIVLSAHWDGFGKKAGVKGDNIFNAAVDNATGVAGVLELARRLKSREKPLARSVILAFFTAEETGLLGAHAFANEPPVPTNKMVALLNIDSMNMAGAKDYVLQYGDGLQELEDWLAEAAKAQGRHVVLDRNPQNGLFFRSDHFALAQKGVPGLLFMDLGDSDPDYIANRYHKPSDEFLESWQFSGVEQDLNLIYSLTEKLGNSDAWPAWKDGAEFKPARDADLVKP
ncbi:M28 family metallopeptidase [Aliiglaciecola sp. CAU 1673]|uniref:M28 family metallopeptidase n=1 Tax=Aliiglaciecola sp. CAU 1673 TaxID=3032595 RepID=UPI0023DBB021|nr:M28 family metallopeptidase [Aliiglaciecola sp. CAU 1673]MDF2176749.1 M28 family metallopeptidase [Aliiglaciecola sp. CAU 1673]